MGGSALFEWQREEQRADVDGAEREVRGDVKVARSEAPARADAAFRFIAPVTAAGGDIVEYVRGSELNCEQDSRKM